MMNAASKRTGCKPGMDGRKSILTAACAALLMVACDDSVSQDQERGTERETGPAETTQGPAADAGGLGEAAANCEDLPGTEELQRLLREAPEQGEAGGMFSGERQWAAVVNRNGELCAVAVSTEDPAATWPGALGIAKAKAFTANAFSTDLMPLSTARLYTLSQPGRPLYGAANGNPFNAECYATPDNPLPQQGQVCGGTITFGGGLALYRDRSKIGGLGVSGDTPCTDHEIAKRLRDQAELNPPQGLAVDDIQYAAVDGPSLFAHPLCQNTWRNGENVGEAQPSQGYEQQGTRPQGGQQSRAEAAAQDGQQEGGN